MRRLSFDDLRSLAPDREALIECLRPKVTDAHLRCIASFDYGHDRQEHFNALKLLRDQPGRQAWFDWCTREVLELGMCGPPFPNYANVKASDWSKADDTISHAFILACLLRAAPWQHGSGPDDLIFQVSSRLIALQNRLALWADQDVARVFAWLLVNHLDHRPEEDLPFLAVWLIHAGVRRQISITDDVVDKLATWAHDAETDEQIIRDHMSSHFVRDVTFRVWREIGRDLAKDAEITHLPASTQRCVQAISAMLTV